MKTAEDFIYSIAVMLCVLLVVALVAIHYSAKPNAKEQCAAMGGTFVRTPGRIGNFTVIALGDDTDLCVVGK